MGGSGPSRLKRPLELDTPLSSKKGKGSQGSQRKSQWTRGAQSGAAKATLSNCSGPIKTPEEVQLFNQLYPLHTHGTKTNWPKMARAFNDEVIHNLSSPSPKKGLLPKTDRQLNAFEKVVTKEICRGASMDMLTSLLGAARNQPTPLPPNVQHVVGALQHLQASGDLQAKKNQVPAPAPPSKPKYASKAKTDKITKQGEGKKGCRPCGWRQVEGGPTLYQHRATCQAYQRAHKRS